MCLQVVVDTCKRQAMYFLSANHLQHLANREEKSEQMLDCRHELDNMEAELKRIQQEVKRSRRRMRRRRIKRQTAAPSVPSTAPLTA